MYYMKCFFSKRFIFQTFIFALAIISVLIILELIIRILIPQEIIPDYHSPNFGIPTVLKANFNGKYINPIKIPYNIKINNRYLRNSRNVPYKKTKNNCLENGDKSVQALFFYFCLFLFLFIFLCFFWYPQFIPLVVKSLHPIVFVLKLFSQSLVFNYKCTLGIFNSKI